MISVLGKRVVAILALTTCGAADGQGAAPPRVLNSRVVEVTRDGGGKVFCWFELDGDRLIKDYALGRLKEENYEIWRMGAKMPPPPTLAFKTGPKSPGEATPCWKIAAAAKIGQSLWVALEPMPRPKRVMYVVMPPHPHHSVSGGWHPDRARDP